MLRRALVLLVVLALATLMWPAWSIVAHADDPDDHKTAGQVQSEQGHKIARELMCQCGCGLTVAACRDSMTCTVAAGLVEQIERQVAAGKSESEIKDYFVTVYGEQILALPRKSGFSLTAWTTPFLAVGAGAVILSGMVWLWARRRSRGPRPQEPASDSLSPYEERVDQDMLLME
jgi:cytochrome c-type biogenesis protein CcmH